MRSLVARLMISPVGILRKNDGPSRCRRARNTVRSSYSTLRPAVNTVTRENTRATAATTLTTSMVRAVSDARRGSLAVMLWRNCAPRPTGKASAEASARGRLDSCVSIVHRLRRSDVAEGRRCELCSARFSERAASGSMSASSTRVDSPPMITRAAPRPSSSATTPTLSANGPDRTRTRLPVPSATVLGSRRALNVSTL